MLRPARLNQLRRYSARPAEAAVLGGWTGLEPRAAPGYDATTGTLGSIAQPKVGGSPASAFEAYYENGWSLTELLFSALRSEDTFYRLPAHGLRHPLIFYYGHTAALTINKLRVAGLYTEGPVDAAFEALFEVGVDEMRWDDVDKSAEAWPSLETVAAYRSEVRDVMLKAIREHVRAPSGEVGDVHKSHPAEWSLAMICEHERIHLETSSVLIRELPLDLVQRPKEWPADHDSVYANAPAEEVAFLPVEAGTVKLGKPRSVPTYGWDNEFGSKVIEVPAFEASKTPITNGQFLEFVKENGYSDASLWTTEGWAWRSYRNTLHPHFWVPRGPAGLREYSLRLPFTETKSLPLRLPAEVNLHEAKAYAKWLGGGGGRIMTEAEHHRIRESSSEKVPSLTSSDDTPASSAVELRKQDTNTNLAFGSPSAAASSSSSFGSVVGSTWEWCEDSFAALPGFRIDPVYEDFSAPCFDGEHHVIVGGSFASTGNEASKFARFHFRPHFHQHAGFRLVKGCEAPQLSSHDAPPPYACGWTPASFAAKEEEGAAKYETSQQMAAYLDLHFDQSEVPEALQSAAGFPARCAAYLALEAARRGVPTKRALDVGCAVGGATFALAATFDEVRGLDTSERFVQVASDLANGGSIEYTPDHEGRSGEPRLAKLPQPSANAEFSVGDACALSPTDLGGSFDAVLAANLLCRLPDPAKFLDSLPELLNDKGLVYMVSPFSWMRQYTPEDKWLGDGASSAEQLGSEMQKRGFTLLESKDVPLVIRDHSRKFQYIVSHGMLFQKN